MDHPKTLGKYEIEERLGEGGMAEVFRAKSPGVAGFQKTVVIKRILPHLARKQAFVDMFVREAKIAAAVSHRNIVQVFELDQLPSGELLMVMEYVPGTDLRYVLRTAAKARLRIPPWFSVFCMAEVLDGLGYAHQLPHEDGRARNLVHRDVTPSNVFLSHIGEVKLGDFGVARDDTLASQTRAGQLKGKVAYMSPEQLQGGTLDGRSDVFAVGVVLWECLSQRRLFGRMPEFEAMQKIVAGEHKSPSELMKDSPSAFDGPVLAALRPDPSKRLKSASAFRSKLLDALNDVHGPVRREDVRAVVEVFLSKLPPKPSAKVKKTDTQDTPASFSSTADVPVDDLLAPPPAVFASAPPDPIIEGAPEDQEDDGEMSIDFEGEESNVDVVAAPSVPAGVKIMVGRPERAGSVAERPAAAEPPTVAAPRPVSNPDNSDDRINALVSSAARDVVEAPMSQTPFAQESLLAGLDVRRHSAQIADMASSRWATYGVDQAYTGPHAFWLQDHEGTGIGPVAWDTAQRIFQAESFARMSGSARISADQKRWLSLEEYAELTGQTMFVRNDEAIDLSSAMSFATLARRSMSNVCASLWRDRLTARVTVKLDAYRRFELREFDLVEGRPVGAYANVENLQLPELLVHKRLVPKGLIVELIHKSVLLGRSLLEVASAQLATNLDAYRPAVERERLVTLFSWEAGEVFIDTSAKIEPRKPVVTSALALVPQMIVKAFSYDELRLRTSAYMDSALRRTSHYDEDIDELHLSPPQRKLADQLADGKRPVLLMKGKRDVEKALPAVLYALTETDLLQI